MRVGAVAVGMAFDDDFGNVLRVLLTHERAEINGNNLLQQRAALCFQHVLIRIEENRILERERARLRVDVYLDALLLERVAQLFDNARAHADQFVDLLRLAAEQRFQIRHAQLLGQQFRILGAEQNLPLLQFIGKRIELLGVFVQLRFRVVDFRLRKGKQSFLFLDLRLLQNQLCKRLLQLGLLFGKRLLACRKLVFALLQRSRLVVQFQLLLAELQHLRVEQRAHAEQLFLLLRQLAARPGQFVLLLRQLRFLFGQLRLLRLLQGKIAIEGKEQQQNEHQQQRRHHIRIRHPVGVVIRIGRTALRPLCQQISSPPALRRFCRPCAGTSAPPGAWSR